MDSNLGSQSRRSARRLHGHGRDSVKGRLVCVWSWVRLRAHLPNKESENEEEHEQDGEAESDDEDADVEGEVGVYVMYFSGMAWKLFIKNIISLEAH